MKALPRTLTLQEWDDRYRELVSEGIEEPFYGGPLSRRLEDGDTRLTKLRFDNSTASLRLWNFFLSEEDRLRQARESGKKIVGAMKDLGTVPVLADSFPNLVAFYPDGAWWLPCLMGTRAGLFDIADALGVDDSFCPVRAMLGAFQTGAHFPEPDLSICSVGATCDDFSAIAQRLNSLGYPIFWWEIPSRRAPDPGETAVDLPGGFHAPQAQVSFVQSELERIRCALESLAGFPLRETKLREGIHNANRVRRRLRKLRHAVFTAPSCPLPALEMLVAEMLAIHFCSDPAETTAVLDPLLEEAQTRIEDGVGVLAPEAVKVFWVNPVADLRVMNLLEECGGRICGTEYLFCHALEEIPEDLPPLEALARTALADPMVGPASDRARKICRDIRVFGSEAVLISRIPGASHCATEGAVIRSVVEENFRIPVLEIEVPSLSDSMRPTLRTRLEALVETVRGKRAS